MQTFLPYSDYAKSAQVLDRQRLGKQRVEVLQILKALTQPSYGWQNHPAVLMWRGHTQALVDYGIAICNEWTARGYADTCEEKILSFATTEDATRPSWNGDPAFHYSHQSNLIRKLPSHYAPLFPGVSADLPYVWPKPLGN